jgi:hypothetical protein
MITENQRLAGNAVQKCRNGEPLSDEEIAAGISVLQGVIPALLAMGDCYMLAYSDLNRRLSELESFQAARKRR